MSILENYAQECMYERDAWFIDEVLEINPEAKRVVGSRLGQGCFQLLHVQNARPCIR